MNTLPFLRALRSSHDFDAYRKFREEQEYKRNHASHYADHHVPSVVLPAALLSQPSRRGTLKIVKKKGSVRDNHEHRAHFGVKEL